MTPKSLLLLAASGILAGSAAFAQEAPKPEGEKPEARQEVRQEAPQPEAPKPESQEERA
jgi:hypothetical protein